MLGTVQRALARIRRDPDLERLVRQGLRLGRNVYVGRGVYISDVAPDLIEIGDETIIGMGVVVLSHDNSMKLHTGYTRVAPVVIGARVYIGANSVILPGVTIGDKAIIGAGCVVRTDVPAGMVAVGNPLQLISSTEEFVTRHRQRAEAGAGYVR